MANKKVLLISPKNPIGGGSIIPPLGLTTNASYIPDKYDVMIVDENVKQANYSGADLVAVTGSRHILSYTNRRINATNPASPSFSNNSL